MKTETIQVTSKGEVVAEVEIERFEAYDLREPTTNKYPPVIEKLSDFLGPPQLVIDWLNKAYEAEVIKRARKMANAPKITKEMEKKVKKALKNDPEFLEYCVRKLGI